MRVRPTLMLVLVLAAFCSACGAKEPPAAESPQAASAAADDPSRGLSKSECDSLGQAIVDACSNRGNDRSSEADGWCSDMVQRNSDNGTWVESDCLKHFKYMDYYCFQAGKNAHAMMDCDRTVDRSK